MDETKPLVTSSEGGEGFANGSFHRRQRRSLREQLEDRALWIVVLILAVLLLWNHSHSRYAIPMEPEVAGVEQHPQHQQAEPVERPVLYRPFCVNYKSTDKGESYSARILQTSMGNPSQPWSHIPCFSQNPKNSLWTNKNKVKTSNIQEYGLADAQLVVNFTQSPFTKRPPILGFGAAFTEAAALNFNSLSDRGKEVLMELFYGKSGLGYSLGRVPINSVDFSIKRYTFDDVEDDFDLKHFDAKVSHDVESGMVGMILRAKSVLETNWKESPFKMYASPWSPPAWMKKPLPGVDKKGALHAENMTGSTEPTCLRDGVDVGSKYAKAWALYFSKFISAYRQQGIPLWAVTVQNEPEFPAPWEACAYTPLVERKFVQYHLGPTLERDHPDVKILIFDHNKDHVIRWIDELVTGKAASVAAKYVAGTAYHWYAGGMDRLLDGAVGQANLHHLQQRLQKYNVSDDHIVLNSEACHCPTTGYQGGDIDVYWSRAERYAHTILADLAAGSNGWVEWNLVLDSQGGPNHLGNLCDAAVLAVPHRAIGGEDISPKQPWEDIDFKFGPSAGDGRTKAELNAMGIPAQYLDVGLAVQPLYYYMGHISRYVRPGSRALMALAVGSNATNNDARVFRLAGQTFAGGGMNDLARTGIEVTAWPCEGSTRQQFSFVEETGHIEVYGHDWLGKPTTSCITSRNDESFMGVTFLDCDPATSPKTNAAKIGTFDMITSGGKKETVKFKRTNPHTPNEACLILKKLKNKGGTYGPRGGAQVAFGNCTSDAAHWKYSAETGEVISSVLSGGDVCMTTGWPFLQLGAFETPAGESDKVVVILNEAKEAANYVLRNGEHSSAIVSGSIPPRSIQTVLFDKDDS